MNRRSICLFFLMMLILQLPGAAQISTTSALADSIGSIMTMNHIPGLIITVVSKDSIYWQKQMGYADLSNKACVEPSHLFKIGSVTKTFIALAIMKLVEEKKIGLAMRLSEIAPEIPFHNPWEKATPVRICDLLEHKAGFDDTHFSAMTDKSGKSARISAWDEVVANRNILLKK
jgi:CubicO group peptidase (beta-lactamase class C family)